MKESFDSKKKKILCKMKIEFWLKLLALFPKIKKTFLNKNSNFSNGKRGLSIYMQTLLYIWKQTIKVFNVF
jgi:hypothetical protein